MIDTSSDSWFETALGWMISGSPPVYFIIAAALIGTAYCAFRAFVSLSEAFDYQILDKKQSDLDLFGFYRRDLPLFPNGIHVPVSFWRDKGGRQYNEDRHAFMGSVHGHADWAFAAVFDGHGGEEASEFASKHLHLRLAERPDLALSPKEAISAAFRQTDEDLIRVLDMAGRVDGTTALTALLQGDILYIANAGDSRALLVRSIGTYQALSRDHKPSLPDEMKRINDAGGKVLFWGRWRVEGVLAVSRALGDRHLKPYVTAEPEIEEYQLSGDDEDAFLVLATDGVWDVLTNETVAQLVIASEDNFKYTARQIGEEAWQKGSMDNMTIIILDLRRRSRRKFQGESLGRRPSSEESTTSNGHSDTEARSQDFSSEGSHSINKPQPEMPSSDALIKTRPEASISEASPPDTEARIEQLSSG